MLITYEINQEIYSKQRKVYGATFLFGLIFFALEILPAVVSNTVIVWADILVVFGEIAHAFLVFVIAGRIKKETGNRFNFGVERLESLISFLCEVMVMISLLMLSGIAISEIIHPEEPKESLLIFLGMKLIKTVIDAVLLTEQNRITSQHKTRMTITEMETAKHTLVFDIVLGLIAIVCYLLRHSIISWYLSPMASICVCIYFIVECVHRMKGVIAELADMAIPIEDQDQIFYIVLDNHQCINKIISIESRLLNHRLNIDVTVKFKHDASYKEIEENIRKLKQEIGLKYPDCRVRIIIQE